MEKKSKRTLKEDFKMIKRAVKLIETNTPHFVLYSYLYTFFNVIKYVGSNYITATIVDELTVGKDSKRLIIMLCMYGLEIVYKIFESYSWRKVRIFQFISEKWEEYLLNKKSFEMDYCNMEDPLIRAKRQMIIDSRDTGGLGIIMDYLMRLFFGINQLFFCVAIAMELFIRYSDKVLYGFENFINTPWFTVIFFIFVTFCTVGEYKVNRKYNRLSVGVERESSMVGRLLHYYLDDYIDDSKACKDIHIFNQKNIIRHSSDEIYKSWIVKIKELFMLFRKKNNSYNIFYMLATTATYLFVALKTYIGAFGIGGFLKYHFSISNVIMAVEDLSDSIAYLRSNNDYLEIFFEYLDIPTEMHYGTIPTEKRMDNKYDIEFHNVSFKYPNTEKYVIKNLNFKFRVGDRIAVVGMNGSGKTTMIKLLCRLYDPTEGYITLNGIDIQKYDYEDYLNLFSVVFQDFRLFSFSVGENVAASVEYDETKVWDSLNKAGMLERVKAMPEGLKTPIYKDFEENGVEISGGEAQKLAIARALYKDAAFVILDEPTASLDPIAEHEIYSRFNDMVKDKTAVYISHRLSSCRFCDRIIVFDDGALIQDGSHDKLLENIGGKYYELWNAQAQYYTKKQA